MLGESRIWGCASLLACMVGCAICGQDQKRVISGEERAGYPSEISPCAQPSDTGKYTGYLVGGGSPYHCLGDGPVVEEGTWGWDYEGYFLPSRVILDWFHGCLYQGGNGAYKTDGPRPIEDLEHRND